MDNRYIPIFDVWASIYCSMGSAPVGVQCRLHHRSPRSAILHFLLSVWISSLRHSLMLSSHSLHGLPLLVSPSIIPNITSFTSLLSFLCVQTGLASFP